MKYQTNALEGQRLNFAVDKALYPVPRQKVVPLPDYCGDGAVGIKVITAERISIDPNVRGEGWYGDVVACPRSTQTGPDPLIAAMRSLVWSRFGDEVELP